MSLIDIYLALERIMLDLDRTDNPAADAIRDLMDRLWYQLSDEERVSLDTRTSCLSSTSPSEAGTP